MHAASGLIAFDLDGTVFADRAEQRISPRVERAFAAAHRAGYVLAVATGRPQRDLAPDLLVSPWLSWCIAASGAVLLRAGETLPVAEHVLDPALVRKVVRLAGDAPQQWWGLGPDGFTCSDSPQTHAAGMFVPPGAHRVADICEAPACRAGYYKVVARFTDARRRERVERLLAPLADEFELATEGPLSLEMTGRGVSKGAAALELCERLGIDPARSYAFGDSGNDLSFAATPLTFVAMGSAEDAVRAAADDVCADVFHDGVARWLEEHVLGV